MSIRTILTLLDVEGLTASGQGDSQDVGTLDDFVGEVVASEEQASTSLDVVIEDSFDGGTTWHDWITFTQLTTTGKEAKAPSRPPGGDVRAKYTIVGGEWDVRVKLSAIPAG